MKAAGYPSARKVKAAYEARHGEPVKLAAVADVLLKIEENAVELMLDGRAKLTGKTRCFGRAVAAEIRCLQCGRCYWETGLPYALCVDCRK